MTERTDRELMELAAKAAGIQVHRGIQHQSEMLFRSIGSVDGRFSGIEWDPLDDDSDALQLAVTLDIAIEPRSDRSETEACTWVSTPGGMETIRRAVPHGDDPGAATRRAIVLLAAALWEQIQANRAAAMAEGGEHG